MGEGRRAVVVIAAAALVGLGLLAGWLLLSARGLERDGSAARAPAGGSGEAARPVAPSPHGAQIRWLASGGGPTPDANEVSIEQDMALVREALGPGGRLLFAGGPGSDGVQVRGRPPGQDDLMRALGEIFSPRGGRDALYRPTRLDLDGPATLGAVEEALREALSAQGDPLLLVLAGHGDMGERPDGNAVLTWGGEALGVVDLARALDTAPTSRPVRAVVLSCYAGGFAELIFHDADESQGPSPHDRCGIFASTWDLQAGGCDADPDRGRHEGYSLHLLHALKGQNRRGEPLAEIDLDGDGRISLIEAHTQARIASGSVDVPTTTSERWLRHAAPSEGASEPVSLPAEERTIEALSAALGLQGHPERAADLAEALGQEIEELKAREEAAADAEQAAYRALAGELLARWPVIDDPWHPDFPSTIQGQRAQIEGHLAQSDAHARLREAMAALDALGRERAELQVRAAPFERLARAVETRALAGRLKALGGEPWRTFERLSACERFAPGP